MRIIIALHQYFPGFSAGTEVLADQVARGLQQRGHEVMVFTGEPVKEELNDAERFVWSEYRGIPILRFLHQHRSMAGEYDLVRQEYDSVIVQERFGTLLDEWNPTLVHFFNFARISSSPIECCTSRKIPFLYTATDYWSVCLTARLQLEDGSPCAGPESEASNCIAHMLQLKRSSLAVIPKFMPGLFRSMVDFCQFRPLNNLPPAQMVCSAGNRLDVIKRRLRLASRILVPTQEMKRIMEGFGLEGPVLKVLPYGVAMNNTTRRIRSLDAESLRVGFIGTIAFHKGLHDLVKAFSFVRDLNLKLSVFGDNTLFPDYVESFCAELEDDGRIKFEGTFRIEDIDSVIDGLDVLVVPSVWRENSPLVVLEALARNCPVLASRQNGMMEFVVDGKNGLLFNPGSPVEIANVLRRIALENCLLEKLSSGCEIKFGMDDYLNEIESNYFSVV